MYACTSLPIPPQLLRSLSCNLQRAEAFFLSQLLLLRSSVHAAVASRDAAAARALKRQLKSLDAFLVLNMNGFDKVAAAACEKGGGVRVAAKAVVGAGGALVVAAVACMQRRVIDV